MTRKIHSDELQTQIAAAVEHVGDAIEITDLESRLLYVNPAWERITGYPRDEALGQTPGSLLRSAFHDEAFYNEIWRTISSGQIWRGQMVGRRKDGTTYPQDATISPIRDGAGAITHFVAIKRDASDRARMEAQLIMADRLASLGTLAAGVAHEVNNPLACVSANLDCMIEAVMVSRSDAATSSGRLDEMEKMVRDAREAVDRVRSIMIDLKTFSRGDRDERTAIDVARVLESAMSLARNEIRHRAKLVRDYSSTPGVRVNEARLCQVFLNLVVNAVQAMPDDRDVALNEVKLRTRLVADRVVIEVEDNGVGIAPENLARVFDPFFTTKAQGVGTGLGLSICHGIIVSFGGEMVIHSTVGEGTIVSVYLPAVIEPRTSAPPQTSSVRPSGSPSVRARVLVIDDEPLVAASIERALRKHDITVAQCGADALELLDRDPTFDVIVCDLMMPDLSGMAVYERACAAHPQLANRFLFVTGGAFTEEGRAFLDRAGADYVEKPFEVKRLREAVEERIPRPEGATDRTGTLGQSARPRADTRA